ncbi:polysaccharide lyase [Catenuloplanes sp. NPDC051500]|uniref:polysaccharide lyase n=1 Tax=Catenuloplanes sp. NPDC051500 TaxID=3363959 RepID=UPI003788654F
MFGERGQGRYRRAAAATLIVAGLAGTAACAGDDPTAAPIVVSPPASTGPPPASAAASPSPGFQAGLGAGPSKSPSRSPSPSPPPAKAPDGRTVLATDFERATAGTPYGKGEWAADGWAAEWELGMSGRARADATAAHSGSRALRVDYPKGEIGPEKSGAQAPFPLDPRRDYFVSQWVRFGPGFSFGTTNFAGKVGLGLAGGDSCSGGQACDGTNGFSSRLIWGRDGKASIYYYSMDHESQYGDAADINLTWPQDRWVNVVQRLTVNTVSGGAANPDGAIEVWVNGARTAHITGLRFVSNGDQVDSAYFSSFAGGGDTTFAPRADSHILYDDLEVSTGWPATAAARR